MIAQQVPRASEEAVVQERHPKWNHHLLGVPMQAFTHFSKHAFDRIAQRTHLRCEDIARILDQKLALNTGRKPGLNRNHLLFYSIPDDDFFVAIQDELTGTIVTVLPLDYSHSS